MDIFGRKRIAKLETQLCEVEKECYEYADKLAELTVTFKELGELQGCEPEGCVRGPWCKACEFVKTFYYTEHFGFGNFSTTTAYVCGKGKSCEHFIQKKLED